MVRPAVAVAIPTLDGAPVLEATLAAVRRQTVTAEIVVLDSSSTDATREIAAAHGAAVHVVEAAWFGHGRARNRLMALTDAPRVAFLTQDAEPAHDGWLQALLDGLDAEAGVGLAYGPYAATADASASVRREYAEFFPTQPRVWRAADLAALPAPSPATFVSSANLCLERAAWEQVPFRDVPYAEDQRLGLDLLRAGWAKAYVSAAAVRHAHRYGPVGKLRRSFDEFRALDAVHDWQAPAHPRVLAGTVRVEVRRDRAFMASDRELPAAVGHHAARVLGAALGTRADRLPPSVRRLLSAEGRAG